MVGLPRRGGRVCGIFIAVGPSSQPYPGNRQLAPSASLDAFDAGDVEQRAQIVRQPVDPLGDGRFGHADLLGNLRVWAADSWASPTGATTCNDCVFLSPDGQHVTRGCSWNDYQTNCTVAYRQSATSATRDETIGFRCGRAL